jgi:hypothetical protein
LCCLNLIVNYIQFLLFVQKLGYDKRILRFCPYRNRPWVQTHLEICLFICAWKVLEISILIVAWIFGKWNLSFWLWDRGVCGSSWDPRWSQQPKLQPFAHVLWKKQSILNNAKDMPFASFVIWVWFTFKRGYGWMYYIIILISHI